MIRDSCPVISCCGDEDLVDQFEDRCMQTLGTDPIFWPYSASKGSYTVRFSANFTQSTGKLVTLPVRVLSSGRSIIPVNQIQPLIYIFVVGNNTKAYESEVQGRVRAWINELAARNVTDGLLVMVNHDTQFNTPKFFQRLTVLDKISRDFMSNNVIRHTFELPNRDAVDSKAFDEKWNSFLRLLRSFMLETFRLIITDYVQHVTLTCGSITSHTFDFYEMFERKEELAHIYASIGGFEDALRQVNDIRQALSQCNHPLDKNWIQLIAAASSHTTGHTVWTTSPPITNSPSSSQRQRISARVASFYDLHSYLLALSLKWLHPLGQVDQFVRDAHSSLCQAVGQGRRSRQSTSPCSVESTWVFLTSLHALLLGSPMPAEALPRDNRCRDWLVNVINLPYLQPSSRQSLIDLNELEAYAPNSNLFVSLLFPAQAESAGPLSLLFIKLLYRFASRLMVKQSVDSLVHRDHLDLWLLAFRHLEVIGASQSIPVESLQATSNQLDAVTSQDDYFTLNAMHYLELLLTQGNVIEKDASLSFADFYMAFGQLGLGLLLRAKHLRESAELAWQMADFLVRNKAYAHAAFLLDHASRCYSGDQGWFQLTAHLQLKLVHCLRKLLDKPLASTHRLYAVKLDRLVSLYLTMACQPSWTVNDDVDLWQEAIRRRFTPKSVDQKYELSVETCPELSGLIVPNSIDLLKPTESGRQAISLTFDWLSDARPKADLNVFGVCPNLSDWMSTMKLQLDHDSSCLLQPVFKSGLLDKSRPHSVSGTNVDHRRHSGTLVKVDLSEPPRRISQLAASKRHDPIAVNHRLGLKGHQRTQSLLALDKLNQPSPHASPVIQTTPNSPNDEARVRDTKPMTSKSPYLKLVDHRRHNLDVDSSSPSLPDTVKFRPRLTKSKKVVGHPVVNGRRRSKVIQSNHSESLFASDSSSSSTGEATGPSSEALLSLSYLNCDGDTSLVQLHQGTLVVKFVADTTDFILPKRLRIGLVKPSSTHSSDRKGRPAIEIQPENDPVHFYLTIHLDPNLLGASWRNFKLLSSMLPKLRLVSCIEGQSPYYSVLGLRHPFNVDFVPGQLSLSNTLGLKALSLGKFGLSSSNSSTTASSSSSMPRRDQLIRPDRTFAEYVTTTNSATVDRATTLATLDVGSDNHFKVKLVDDEVSVTWQQGGVLGLVHPASISPTSLADQYVLTTPVGNLSYLPIEVIRPFVFGLKLVRYSTSLLFILRVGCQDLSRHTSSTPADQSTNDLPTTFRLFDYGLSIRSPLAKRGGGGHRQRSGSESLDKPTTIMNGSATAESTPVPSNGQAPGDDQSEEVSKHRLDCLLLDSRLTEVFVNRFTPVNVIWTLSSAQFEAFTDQIAKNHKSTPKAFFYASFHRQGDPDWQASLAMDWSIVEAKPQNSTGKT